MSSSLVEEVLQQSWLAEPIDQAQRGNQTARIGLYRIIGNPLPPRHDTAQLLRSIQWMVDKEPVFPETDVIFVLNRLYSATQAKKVKDIVAAVGHQWIEIPFNAREYRGFQPMDTLGLPPSGFEDLVGEGIERFRRQNANLYLMHNNGARNFALEHGLRQGYRWSLPFDGNCFFDQDSWRSVTEELKSAEEAAKTYVAFPLQRTSFGKDGKLIKSTNGEHQIAFARTSRLKFNPLRMYGFRPKVDLLWRLQVPGVWDNWGQSIFDMTESCELRPFLLRKGKNVETMSARRLFPLICTTSRTLLRPNTAEAALTVTSLHPVMRLPDAERVAENDAFQDFETPAAQRKRAALRTTAIKRRIDLVDQTKLTPRERALNFRNTPKPLFFNIASMETLRRMYLVRETNRHTAEVAKLIERANQMIRLAEFSVTGNTSLVKGIGVQHYQNDGLYDWRACDLPDDVWANKNTVLLTANDSIPILSGEVPVRNQGDCFTYYIWDGKVHREGGFRSQSLELNDQTRSFDFHSNFTMYNLAYYYTNNPQYAEKAVQLARKWWLDPKTAMWPTMQYAPFGHKIKRRYHSVIELKDLSWVLDSAYLLQQSSAWTNVDAAAFKQWCVDYHTWLADSEPILMNNHAWYYMLQISAVWKCAGATDSELGDMLLSRIGDLVNKLKARNNIFFCCSSVGYKKYPNELKFSLAGDLPLEPKRWWVVNDLYSTLFAMILAWRASENLGLNISTSPLQEFEDGLFKTVKTVLNSSHKVRRRFADEDKFTKRDFQNHETLLCAWLSDVVVSRKSLGRQQIDDLCGDVPRKPPLILADPHSGIFPFFSMW